MRVLLDSNTCIRFLNKRSPKLIESLVDMGDEDVFVCSVVKAEMFYGSAKSRDPQRNREVQSTFFSRYRSLPFDDRAAEVSLSKKNSGRTSVSQ